MRHRRSAGQLRRRVDIATAIGNGQRLARHRRGRKRGLRPTARRRPPAHRPRCCAPDRPGRSRAGPRAARCDSVALSLSCGSRTRGLDTPLRIRRQAVLADRRRRWRDSAAGRRPSSRSSAWSTSPPQTFAGELDAGAQQFPPGQSWRGGDALPPCPRPRPARRSSPDHEDCGRPSPAARGRCRRRRHRRSADNPQAAGRPARACRSRSPHNGLRARGRAPSRRRRRRRSSRAPARPARTWSRSRRPRSRRPPPAPRRRLSAALRDCAATMPPLETTAGLRICWPLLNWSLMLLLPLFLISFANLATRDTGSACPRTPCRETTVTASR